MQNCLKVKSFEGAFMYSPSLIGSLPETLFDDCILVENFERTFMYCFNLEGNLTPNLFSKCNHVSNAERTFFDCVNLKGTVPDLWERPNITKYTYCYRGCYGISNFDEVPCMWGGPC